MEQMYTNVLKLQITELMKIIITWNPPQQVTHVSMNYLWHPLPALDFVFHVHLPRKMRSKREEL